MKEKLIDDKPAPKALVVGQVYRFKEACHESYDLILSLKIFEDPSQYRYQAKVYNLTHKILQPFASDNLNSYREI
jgi:hypothetical protein